MQKGGDFWLQGDLSKMRRRKCSLLAPNPNPPLVYCPSPVHLRSADQVLHGGAFKVPWPKHLITSHGIIIKFIDLLLSVGMENLAADCNKGFVI